MIQNRSRRMQPYSKVLQLHELRLHVLVRGETSCYDETLEIETFASIQCSISTKPMLRVSGAESVATFLQWALEKGGKNFPAKDQPTFGKRLHDE